MLYEEIPPYNPTGEFAGIKAITYDGVDRGGKKTKVFAYLGYPENRKEKAPAMVLVHGGGGVPFACWVKMWNRRGYAAIAMSTTGDFPKIADTGAYPEEKGIHREPWRHGMHGVFSQEGYTDAPENDEMGNFQQPMDQQWMYHALSQVILSHNILREDERIDKDKIGITGISWGGVIASLAIGYDNRYAFGIPIYGSGYLRESMGGWGRFSAEGETWKPGLRKSAFIG